MIKYWNEDYYFSYLHLNEEEKKLRGWVSSCIPSGGGERSRFHTDGEFRVWSPVRRCLHVIRRERVLASAHHGCAGGTMHLCRCVMKTRSVWRDGPGTGAFLKRSAEKSQVPVADLRRCTPVTADAGPEHAQRWVNAGMLCCCCAGLQRSQWG